MRISRLLALVPFLMLAAGCQCGPLGVDTTRFACSTDADCLSGFSCRDLGQGDECVRKDVVVVTDAGGDAGVVDAGGDDAGEPMDASVDDAGLDDAGLDDAGADDAGLDDAGLDDAGSVDAGGVDAGGLDAGTSDAGTPVSKLAFTSAAQTVNITACSQQIVVETRNAANQTTPVAANTTVTLAGAPAGLSFYGNQNCAGQPNATGTATITAGNSTATFYAAGSAANSYTLTATSTGLTSAMQTLVVQNAPNQLAFTNTPPATLRGGTCMPVSLESRRGGVAVAVTANSAVGLVAGPTGGAIFYSDANCTTAITTTQIALGSSTVALFVKPLTGGTVTLTANASFASAMQVLTVVPIVRRGQCTFNARVPLPDGGAQTDLSNTCTFSPAVTDLNASMLFSASTAVISTGELGVIEVRCRLATTTTVACNRRQDADPASVHFQIAEVPTGLLVQRSTATNCPGTVTLPTAVTPSKSFVLKSVANATANFDDEDTFVAQLTGPTTVSVSPTTCEGYDLQVVQWDGLTVDRGFVDGGMPLGALSASVTALPAAGSNRAVLAQPHTTVDGARPLCSTLVRPSMPSASSLSFSRAAGDAGCPLNALEQVHYERIDFGSKASVREYSATFAPGVTSRTVTITPIDTTRTVVFSASQISGGQGAGESDFDGPAGASEGLFQLVLTNSSTVTVTRAEASSAAGVTFYVAQLSP